MGRVYDLRANQGEFRFFTVKGVLVERLLRVEFDTDADEGMATVVQVPVDAKRNLLIDYASAKLSEATFRTWLRCAKTGRPAPEPTPDAVLYVDGMGGVMWHATDPFPDGATTPTTGAASRG